MNKPSTTTYREPDVTHYRTDYDVDGKLQSYRDGIQQYQMLSQEMEEKFYKTIESVKKYGGFYIGRYETGGLRNEKAVVQKMNTDISYQTWYKMYELCKNLAGEKGNVQTSIIWGSLWDETLQWLLESDAQIKEGNNETRSITERDVNSDSKNWGNYMSATFDYITTNGKIATKSENSIIKISTGSSEYTKANNIYDIAGNVRDWTLETGRTNARVCRGGYYYYENANSDHAGARWTFSSEPSDNYYSSDTGCRAILLIK